MPNEFYIQNNFTHGELDPRLFAGVNLDYYYKSVSKARNVYVRPQGGLKRRHGTVFQYQIPANYGEYRNEAFIYDDDNEFLLTFLSAQINVYKKDLNSGDLNFFTSISGSPYASTYTGAQLQEIDVAQVSNLMVIVHPDIPIKQLTYDGTTFTFGNFVFKNSPTFDFDGGYFDYTFTVTPQAVGKSAALVSTSDIFNSRHVDGLFISLGATVTSPIGVARIRSVTDAKNAVVEVISAFDSALGTGILGDNCSLQETAYNSTRGYPGSLTFYEDRLVVGGSPSLPQTIYMSKVNDYSNFDIGQQFDDDAIAYTLSSNNYNKIVHIESDKSLQIFGTDAEFSSMQIYLGPLTPSSVSIRKQSSYGASSCRPQVLDNQTFFVRKGGKSVMSFVPAGDGNSFTSVNASLFSAHLVNNPISSAVLKGDALEDADYLFFVNEDGSLLAYQTMQQQQVSAWTISVTGNDITDLSVITPSESKFKEIINVGNTIYVAVERYIDLGNKNYIERLGFDATTDSASFQNTASPTNVVTNLSHLEGELVRHLYAIGRPSPDSDQLKVLNFEDSDTQTVTSGQVTLIESESNIEVGMRYDTYIETVPVNVVGSNRLYVPKKIVRGFIDYYESIGIKVNGEVIPELNFGNDVLDNYIKPKTGFFTIRGNEWGSRETIVITQEVPVPFLIIGIGYEVAI